MKRLFDTSSGRNLVSESGIHPYDEKTRNILDLISLPETF